MEDRAIEMLRHTLATLAYRSAKVLRDAPEGFGDFRVAARTRRPVEILAHMGDLMEWAVTIARGKPAWKDSEPLEWEQECERYFAALDAVERCLRGEESQRKPERIFQGPIADALTHTGQLGLLRGLAGKPVRGENYYVAPIEAGRVGREQGPAGFEF